MLAWVSSDDFDAADWSQWSQGPCDATARRQSSGIQVNLNVSNSVMVFKEWTDGVW